MSLDWTRLGELVYFQDRHTAHKNLSSSTDSLQQAPGTAANLLRQPALQQLFDMSGKNPSQAVLRKGLGRRQKLFWEKGADNLETGKDTNFL